MKILCCGDREWNDWEIIKRTLAQFPGDTTLVEGACRGADQMSRIVGDAMGLKGPDGKTRPSYPADWARHKKAAGPIRNRKMFDLEQPDLVIAFHENLDKSSGTKDMVQYAETKGCMVWLVSSRGTTASPLFCKDCRRLTYALCQHYTQGTLIS